MTVTAQLMLLSLVDSHTKRDEKGQTSAEYLGIVVVVAVLIGALVPLMRSDVAKSIKDGIASKIGEIVSHK